MPTVPTVNRAIREAAIGAYHLGNGRAPRIGAASMT
jgi:hypothetical protein